MRAKTWRAGYTGMLLFILLLARPGVSLATTIYTLTGDPYNSCSGSYLASGGGCGPYALSGWFEVSDAISVDDLNPMFGQGGLLSPEFPLGNLDSYIVAYSFSDGSGLTISSTEPGAGESFNIATDGSGNIVWWDIDLCLTNCSTGPGDSNEESYWFPSYPQAYEESSTPSGMGSCFAFGASSPVGNCGGGWSAPESLDTPPSSVPEPSSLVLLGVGLLAIGVTLRRIDG